MKNFRLYFHGQFLRPLEISVDKFEECELGSENAKIEIRGFYAARQTIAESCEDAAAIFLPLIIKELRDNLGNVEISRDFLVELEDFDEVEESFSLINSGFSFY